MLAPLGKLDSIVELVSQDTVAELLGLASGTPLGGCFVEVGVYQGGTARQLHELAMHQQRLLYLYDTFAGIPFADLDKGDAHIVGDFADTSYEAVQALCPFALITAGVFPGSAVPMPPVAFAHLDCDQYRSVRDSLAYLGPLMASGGIIWLDDSPCLGGAHAAAQEVYGDRLELSRSIKHYIRF